MINRGGIDDLLLARKMARLATVQDVQHYSHGGETKTAAYDLQSMGRNGDTLLAHITPEEASVLKALGGAGTTNPHTGLPEFYRSGGDSSYDSSTDSFESGTSSGNYAAGSEARESNWNSDRGGRDSGGYSGPVSRFGTDVTLSNIKATQPTNVSPSGNFDIYGGLGGGSDLISPAPAPSFRATEFSTPFGSPFVSPTMTASRMQQNPASSDFNYKAMESLNPWFQTKSAAFLNTMMDKGLEPYFSSGSRTVAQQADIYANPSPYGAAPPGMSAHNFGQAFDIGGLTNKQMIDAGLMAEAEGLGWGGRFKTYDPVHFQEMPSTASPAQYAASVGAPMFKGTSVGGVQTAGLTRPEPFDVGQAITDRASQVFTPGGIGSLVLGAVAPPVGLYDLAANVVNMAGGNLPTTASMINNNLGITAPGAPQSPVLPPQVTQPQRPVTETPDSSTVGGPTTRGVYDIYANADYTSGGPTTRGVAPARMQVADLSGTTVPSQEAAAETPAAPAEQGWWDKLFNNPEAVQNVLSKPNTYNPGYANTTSGLTKEQWAEEMQVDPNTVKARITTMNGEPQVDWYTKGLDEALMEMVTGPFNAISGALGFGKGQAANTEEQPYIPSGGIGDHQTTVAQNLYRSPSEEEPTTPAKKKIFYEVWPSTEEDYSGPYEKFIV